MSFFFLQWVVFDGLCLGFCFYCFRSWCFAWYRGREKIWKASSRCGVRDEDVKIIFTASATVHHSVIHIFFFYTLLIQYCPCLGFSWVWIPVLIDRLLCQITFACKSISLLLTHPWSMACFTSPYFFSFLSACFIINYFQECELAYWFLTDTQPPTRVRAKSIRTRRI